MGILAILKKKMKKMVHNHRLSRSIAPVPDKFYFPLHPCQSRSDSQQKVLGWGIHLGLDFDAKEGADVYAAARGVVVATWYEPGTKEKAGFGHVVVIAHRVSRKKFIYTLYGHLGKILIKKGEDVSDTDIIGTVGKAYTPENGFWDCHLHFAIYNGPFPIFTRSGHARMLPGYLDGKTSNYTNLEYWEDPLEFIAKYNRPV